MVQKLIASSRRVSLFIVTLGLGALGAAFLFPKATHATTLLVVHESGTLSSSTTWSSGSVYMIDNMVTVPSGITLTISAGAIVKTNQTYVGIDVQNGGTLDVSGSALNPVVFTSYADDSFGGDSNGDGASTGGYHDYAGQIQPDGGTIDVAYADFEAHGASITVVNSSCSGTLGTLTVTDSTIDGTVYMSSRCASGADFERNAFAVPSNIGIPLSIGSIDATGIPLSGLNENTFSGSPIERRVEIGGSVPTGETWSIDSSSGAIVKPYLTVDGTMSVGDDVTLYLDPGGNTSVNLNGTMNVGTASVIKTGANATGIAVNNGGTLNVNGTSTSTTTFTSYKDDTLGGDTNGDGSSSGAVNDYATAIAMLGGTVNATYTSFLYGTQAFNTPSSCSGSLGTLTVTDSVFSAPINMFRCISAVSLERNNFTVPLSAGAAIALGNGLDVTGIVLSGSDENTFSGTAAERTVEIGGSVPTGETWEVDGDSNAVLKPGLTVDGTLEFGNDAVAILDQGAITVNGALNADPGAVLKLESPYDILTVNSGGTLNFAGSSMSPVTLTSYKDDSVAGDTNGDSTATSPAADDYQYAARIKSGATVTTAHTVVKYAIVGFYIEGGDANFASTDISNVNDGLDVGGGTVSFRGSFDNISHRAIYACNWDSTCTVDATHVDWNSSDPTSGGNDIVCGQVLVSPWIVGMSTGSAGVFAVHNCDNSATPDIALGDAASTFAGEMAAAQLDCSHALSDACGAYDNAETCLSDAVDAAAGTTPFTLPSDDPISAAGTWAGDFFTAMATYFSTNAETVVTGARFSYASDLLGAVGTVHDLTDAYNSCFHEY